MLLIIYRKCFNHVHGLRSRPPFTGVRFKGPGPESAPRSAFWAPGSECPKDCFLSVFWRFFCPKKAKKNSKSSLWGTPSQVPKNTQKALRGALSGPGPKSTPVNGGRDRNHVQNWVFTKCSVVLERVSLLNPRLPTNFVACPIERTRKEPRSSVRFWAATGV